MGDLRIAGPKAELEKSVQGLQTSGLCLKEVEYYSPVEPAEHPRLRRIRRTSLAGRYIKANPRLQQFLAWAGLPTRMRLHMSLGGVLCFAAA